MDAGEGAIQAAGEGFGEGGLADAGDIFEEEVSVGEERDQKHFDNALFTDDGLGDIGLHGLGELGEGHEVHF